MKKASLSVPDGIRGIAAKDQIIRNDLLPQVRLGFTLIELLIVVVIIGILAGIAIPKYESVREKSYIAAVKSDLKIMATQMEIYQSDNLVYPADIALLVNFTASEGVNITINEATAGTGWAATGNHVGLTGAQCGYYYGNGSATNAVPATSPGVVTCE